MSVDLKLDLRSTVCTVRSGRETVSLSCKILLLCWLKIGSCYLNHEVHVSVGTWSETATQ